MTSINLTDSDEKAIVDYCVKDHEELYDRTNKHFKDKACGRGSPASYNLSVKLCKTWCESQRTRYRKLTQSKSDQALKDMTGRLNSGQVCKDAHQMQGTQQIIIFQVPSLRSQCCHLFLGQGRRRLE